MLKFLLQTTFGDHLSNLHFPCFYWKKTISAIILVTVGASRGDSPCLHAFLSLQIVWIAAWKTYRNRKIYSFDHCGIVYQLVADDKIKD